VISGFWIFDFWILDAGLAIGDRGLGGELATKVQNRQAEI
jgi:hypothetical protein